MFVALCTLQSSHHNCCSIQCYCSFHHWFMLSIVSSFGFVCPSIMCSSHVIMWTRTSPYEALAHHITHSIAHETPPYHVMQPLHPTKLLRTMSCTSHNSSSPHYTIVSPPIIFATLNLLATHVKPNAFFTNSPWENDTTSAP